MRGGFCAQLVLEGQTGAPRARASEMHSVFGLEDDDNGYLFAKRSPAGLGRSVGPTKIIPANPAEYRGSATDKTSFVTRGEG